jgi:hypothetical protein
MKSNIVRDVSTRVQPSLSPRSDPRGPSPHRWRALSGSRQDEVMENLARWVQSRGDYWQEPPPTANTLGITGVAAFAPLLGKPPVFW